MATCYARTDLGVSQQRSDYFCIQILSFNTRKMWKRAGEGGGGALSPALSVSFLGRRGHSGLDFPPNSIFSPSPQYKVSDIFRSFSFRLYRAVISVFYDPEKAF